MDQAVSVDAGAGCRHDGRPFGEFILDVGCQFLGCRADDGGAEVGQLGGNLGVLQGGERRLVKLGDDSFGVPAGAKKAFQL